MCLFNVNNKTAREWCGICTTITTLEGRNSGRSGLFNSEYISHLSLVFTSFTLSMNVYTEVELEAAIYICSTTKWLFVSISVNLQKSICDCLLFQKKMHRRWFKNCLKISELLLCSSTLKCIIILFILF